MPLYWLLFTLSFHLFNKLMSVMSPKRKISVIGLGYVGLPLAIAFAKQYDVVGYDNNPQRIKELKTFYDKTNEIKAIDLQSTKAKFTGNASDLKDADFHIITAPTPIDSANAPDLTCLLNATETVAKNLKPNDIIVYESTVYPGATEEECVPILEKISGLGVGKDFFVGYSPERINPGDHEHSFENIIKVVSGCDDQTLGIIAETYGAVVKAGIFKATSIRVAEAAKVIENTQRDINIAFMNELAKLFHKMDINTQEVLEAAKTKWNFLPFEPGLVGGHCIGVDPYYLTHKAEQYHYHPEIILAGRRINDEMGKYVADQTVKLLAQKGQAIENQKIAILGFTFKENCPDIRNSRVIDIYNELESYGAHPIVHDPIADPEDTQKEYGIQLTPWDAIQDVTAIIIAVAHSEYRQLNPNNLISKLAPNCSIIIDLKSILNKNEFKVKNISIWSL